MKINFEKMCEWEIEKAMFLLITAKKFKMDVFKSCSAIVSVNQFSGYTYLWCENYNFTLYMPINCQLNESYICVMWTNSETGEEIECILSEFHNLQDIQNWVNELELNAKN